MARRRRPRDTTVDIRDSLPRPVSTLSPGLLCLSDVRPLRRVFIRLRRPRPVVDFPSPTATAYRRFAVLAPSTSSLFAPLRVLDRGSWVSAESCCSASQAHQRAIRRCLGFRCAIAGFLRFGSTLLGPHWWGYINSSIFSEFEVQLPRRPLSLPSRASSGECLPLSDLGAGCLLRSVGLNLDNGIGWDCLTSLTHHSEVAPVIPPNLDRLAV